MASPHRVNRVRQSLLREFSDIVRKLKDPRAARANVVDAEISSDLRYAKLFFSVLGSEQERLEATAALQHAAGYIRRELAGRLRLRHVPEVAVVYDDTSERAARVSALIDNLGAPGAAGDAGAPAPEGGAADDDD